MASAKNPKLDAQHQAVLRELLAQPGNRSCADCLGHSPRWASVNLGVFLCIGCSGVHRKMGTHISTVRSTTLDTWTPEQIQRMTKLGNSKVNSIFEACLPPDFKRPAGTDALSVERFIRDKYEKRVWVSKEHGGRGGDRGRVNAAQSERPQRRQPPNTNPSPRRQTYDPPVARPVQKRPSRPNRATDAIEKICDMGFSHGQAALALNEADGEVQKAVEILLAEQSTNSVTSGNLVDISGAGEASRTRPQSRPSTQHFESFGACDSVVDKKPGTSATADDSFADFGEFESAATSTAGTSKTPSSSTVSPSRDLTEKLASLYLQTRPNMENNTVGQHPPGGATGDVTNAGVNPVNVTTSNSAPGEKEWWKMDDVVAPPAATQPQQLLENPVDSFFADLVPKTFRSTK